MADDAFSGCTNLKISTRTDKYQDYLSSATWKEHRSRIIIYEATVEDFEVEGVKYHKYRDLAEKELVKNDEAGKEAMMEQIITWNGDYQNFSAAELLETEDDCNVYYTYVMGVDDSKIDDRGGTMRIYNDPGSYYNYKTIALGRKAIAGNTHVKSIEFWQTNGRSKNSYSDLKMVIPNGALKGCTNLEEIRLYYYAEDGEDRWMQLGPKDVIPGDNIFGLATAEELLEMSEEEQAEQDALRPRNLKILVATELYSDFKNDPNWQPYLAYLEPEDYSPTAKSDFTKDGLTYGYISSPGGIMQTSQVVSQDVSWWTAPRIAIEVAMAAASIYSFASSQSVLESTQVAYSEAMDKAIKKGEDYVGQQAVVKAAETNAAAIASATQQNLGEIVTSIMGSKITSLEGAVSKTVIEQLAEWGVVNTKGMITATTAEAIGNLTTGQFALAQTAFFQYARQKLAEATTKLVECEVLWKSAQKAWSTIAVKRAVAAKATYVLQGIKALPYAVNPVATATSTAGLIASKCWGGSGSYNADAMNKGMRENILSNIHQVGLVGGGYIITTPQKNLVYHTYVKEVGNDVTNAVIYAGKKEGTNESTRTTTFAKKAFQNKTNLQTVKFHENTDNTSNTSMSLCLTIPDSAFVGCTNLREFSTLLQTEENGTQALGPENFTLAGDSIFAGMKSEAEVDSLTKIGEGEGLVAFHIIIDPLRKQDYLENDSWSPLQRFFKYEEAKPAVKFTEYGAKYAYAYENNSIKKENKISGHLIEHTIVVGPDDDFIKGHQGAVKLCNDIGTYNNYQLDEVKAGAFRGNKNVRSVSFTDLKGFLLTGDVYSDLEVSIGDSAFVDCTNLADLDLLYMVTDGSNHLDPMTPSQISIGEGVFDRTNARLKMMPQQVAWFEADSTWATYKDRFMPCVIPLADPGIKSALEDMAYYDPANTGTDQAYWKGYVDLARIGGAGFSWLDGRFTAQKDKIYSFADFRWFASVELDYVGASWFEDCSKLGNITLPSTIKTIQSKAFKGCSSLQEIELPQGVTSIGDNAFAGCSKLNTILVRDSVPATIGTGVFDKHSGLQIYVPAPRVDDYKSKWSEYASYIVGDNDYTFSKVVTVTAPGQLASKLGLTLMKESYVVRYINGPYAKYDSLTVKGPLNGDDIAVLRYLAGANSYDSKQTDGQTKYLNLWDASITEDINVFHGKWDENLQADKVPNYMFESCKMIEEVIFPQSVTAIGKSTFQDASAMKRICVGRNTKEYAKDILKNMNGIEELVFLTNQVCSSSSDDPWKASIQNVYALQSQVGDYMGDIHLTKRANDITAPFKEDAAMWALADKGHFFPSEYFALESVDGIFEDNVEIKTLEDFDQFSNVKTLQTTFKNMTRLETINLPTCIENIGAEAFAGCSALMEIHLGCDSVPTLAADAFKNLPADFTIYVPKRLCKLYRATWEQYADHINRESSNSADDEIITVTLTEPNTLAEKLGLTMILADYSGSKYVNGVRGDYSHIKKLKVIGPISGGDFDVMNYLAGYCSWELDRNYSGHLEYIDLYDAEIQKTNVKVVGYKRNVQSLYLSEDFNLFVVENNVLPKYSFLRAYSLKTLILPKTCKEVTERAMQECEALETLVVGDDCETFDWSSLDDDAMLSRMFILAKKKMEIDSGDAIWNLLCNNYNPTFDAFYVRPSLYEAYLKDDAYTGSSWQRTNNISKGAFEEDASFVAFAAHAAATEDDLAEVYSVNGWFDSHPDVLDLTPLGYAAIDELRAVDIQKLTKLEKVTLPATLTTLEDGVFSQSPNLRYADLLMCDDELTVSVKTRGLAALGIDSLRTLVFVPTYFGTTEGTNIVVSDDSGLHTKTFRMLDDKDYCVPYNFKTAKVVNTRRIIGQGKPYTLFLPYELTFDPSVAKVYKPTDRDGSTVTFEQVADGKVEALKPYVIRPTGRQVSLNTDDERSIPASSGYLGSLSENQWQVPGYTMRGTLSRIDNKDAAERQLMMLAGDTWVTVPADNENAYIAPFRTYILQSGNSAGGARELTMTFWDNYTTPIDTIRTIDSDGTERYYDLNGRQIVNRKSVNRKLPKGIYIYNGKKIINK